MAQPSVFPAPPALSCDDSQAMFEDVMAFLDGFDATTDLSNLSMAVGGAADGDDGSELLFSGFSSDTSDEDLLFAHSEELLGLLDATILTSQPGEALQAGIISDSTASFTESAHKVLVNEGQARPVKEATRKRNAYREKMKRELQYLRLRTAEMEEQLIALRHGAVTVLSPEDKRLIDSSWKRIAKNQSEARIESEAENLRLKSVLQSHMEMARCLEEQSLGKRFNVSMLTAETKPKVKRGRTSSVWEDEGYADLASDLDSSFERVHHVLKDAGLDSAATDATRSFVRKTAVSASGVATPYTELTDTAVTPFHPRLTAKAVWRSIRDQYHQKRAGYESEKLWQSGNTLAAKCRYAFKTKSDQATVNLNCKVVLRKYVDEESRMVLVWRAHNEGGGEHAGVYADETGWCVIQPIPGSCGYSSNGSVIHTCIHVVHRRRDTLSSAEDAEPTISVLTDLVMASNKEDMIGITKAVENMLLNEVKAGVQDGDSVGS